MPANSVAVQWIREAARHSRRVATVCTAAFLAGRAGLLEGRTVATHWSRTAMLQAEFPGARVDPDLLYLRDGDLWSSGGVTAGIDLALALVEDDHDGEIAQLVARHLVLPWRRPGGQSQYAVPMWAPRGSTPPIARAQRLIDADPAADHRAAILAGTPETMRRTSFHRLGVPPDGYRDRFNLNLTRGSR